MSQRGISLQFVHEIYKMIDEHVIYTFTSRLTIWQQRCFIFIFLLHCNIFSTFLSILSAVLYFCFFWHCAVLIEYQLHLWVKWNFATEFIPLWCRYYALCSTVAVNTYTSIQSVLFLCSSDSSVRVYEHESLAALCRLAVALAERVIFAGSDWGESERFCQ